LSDTRFAKLLPLLGAAVLAACASSGRIDGSSAAAVERSVALLQNDLSTRRREDFEVALAVIYLRTAGLDRGDTDGDGDEDYFDARSLADTAGDLFDEIRRGNLVSTIESLKGAGVAAAYFAQLDGLGYDEVVKLGGEAADGYLAEIHRVQSQAECAQLAGRAPPVRGFGGRIDDRCD
jgi:hypothetical protein